MENMVQTRSELHQKRFRSIQYFLEDPPVIEQERLLNTRIERYGSRSRSRKQQKSSANSLRLFLVIICIGVFAYCAVVIATYLLDGYQSSQLIQSIRAELPSASQPQQGSPSAQLSGGQESLPVAAAADASMQEYQSLLTINPDAAGWLSIAGTNISYPVARANDNMFYLTHSFAQKQSAHGSIFMDYRNGGQKEDSHILIYGHNMRDGSMFGNLTDYKNESYFRDHPTITLNLRGETAVWQIFSVSIANDDALPVDFSDQTEFEGFLTYLKADSLYETGVTVDTSDQILTLSTCSRDYENARFTVHAKKAAATNE